MGPLGAPKGQLWGSMGSPWENMLVQCIVFAGFVQCIRRLCALYSQALCIVYLHALRIVCA